MWRSTIVQNSYDVGLVTTSSMEILATCENDGIEVTWQTVSGSAVKLVQLEYSCREVTIHNQEVCTCMH